MNDKPLFTCEDPINITMLEAIKKVIEGKWTLAPFQRPKSWKWAEQKLLLDSLLRGIPIGIIYLWDREKNSQQPMRPVPGIEIKNPSLVEAMLLDGQQRMSLLSWMYITAFDEDFSKNNGQHGPGIIFFNTLTGNFSKQEVEKVKGNVIPGVVIKVQRIWTCSDVSELYNLIQEANEYTSGQKLIMNKNIQRLHPALNTRKIVVQTLTKKASIKDSFNLYERVNNSGKKLTNNDYVEAGLFGAYPGLYHDIQEKTAILRSGEFRSWKESGFFSRSNYLRSIIDELYGTPNVTDRKSGTLKHLENFEDQKYGFDEKSLSKLTELAVKKAFKNVHSAFEHLRSLLEEYLYFYNDNALSPTLAICLNTLLRRTDFQPRVINKTQIGFIIKFIIQFHLANKPYGLSQDAKIKRDCKAARNKDFLDILKKDGLWQNLKTNNKSGDFIPILKANTHYNYSQAVILEYGAFLSKFHLTLFIYNGAQDWYYNTTLSTMQRNNELEAHHIFPQQLFEEKIKGDPTLVKYRDHVLNEAWIKKSTNGSINNNKPEKYLNDIKDRNQVSLDAQFIPLEVTLWKFKNYGKAFMIERRDSIITAGNMFLKKLEEEKTSWWVPKSSPAPAPLFDITRIKTEPEGQRLEFKEAIFKMPNDKSHKDWLYLISKEVAGFMNNGGGELFVGIKDLPGEDRVVGLERDLKWLEDKEEPGGDPKDPKDTLMKMLSARLKADIKLTNFDSLRDKINLIEIEGKVVLHINVPHLGGVKISKMKIPIKDEIIKTGKYQSKTFKNVLYLRRLADTDPDEYVDDKGKFIKND